jgi:hypothetical protein
MTLNKNENTTHKFLVPVGPGGPAGPVLPFTPLGPTSPSENLEKQSIIQFYQSYQ